jgi:hypothetical protein
MGRRLKPEREKTLDCWAESLDNDNKLLQSDMGMIRADVDVLQSNRDRDRQQRKRHGWEKVEAIAREKAFRGAYGVSFDEVRAEDLSSKIFVVMNRRASVLHLDKWQRDHNLERRSELLELADALITSWKEDKTISFIEGSESRRKFDRVEKLWKEGYPI